MTCQYQRYSNIGRLCTFNGMWSKECDFAFNITLCTIFNKIPNKQRKPILTKKEKEKEIKNISEQAYRLYWEHVDPRKIKDSELKNELIRIINKEEYANDIEERFFNNEY